MTASPKYQSDNIKVQTESTGTIGEFKSIMNLALTAVGVGVLALPVAIAQSGYGIGILLLLVTWALTQSMMHLLFRCIQTARSTRSLQVDSYAAIGELAYGKKGKYAVAFAMYLGLSAICVILIQLTGMCLYQLTGSMTKTNWTLIAALCILPLSLLPSLKEIGVLSFIGVVAVLTVCVAVLVVAIAMDPSERGSVEATPIDFPGFAIGFLEFMNGFTVAPVIPSIILSMQNPDQYPRVAAIGFALIALVFAVIGFGGYMAFGSDVLGYGLITVGMVKKKDALGSSAYATVCQVSIIIVCLAHFVVMFNPIAQLSDSIVSKTTSRPLIKIAFSMFARGCLVALMLIPAVFIPHFGIIVDLVAATVVLPLQVIMPILFYVRICRHSIDKMSTTKKYALYGAFGVSIVICIAAMVYGLYKTIANWP